MSTKYAIVGGKLIDGTGAEPVENSLVLVDDNGKIEYAGAMQDLPEGVEVIDAAGKTVLPGLIDTHIPILIPIIALFAWGATIWLMLIGLFFGMRYRIDSDGDVPGSINNLMDSAANAADDIKQNLNDDK